MLTMLDAWIIFQQNKQAVVTWCKVKQSYSHAKNGTVRQNELETGRAVSSDSAVLICLTAPFEELADAALFHAI